MSGEFRLSPSRELTARHALPPGGRYTVQAQRSTSQAEQQRAALQLQPPWGEGNRPLRCADIRKDQAFSYARNFNPDARPGLICPPHAQRHRKRCFCADSAIGTGQTCSLRRANNILRSRGLTPLQPCSERIGDANSRKLCEFCLQPCSGSGRARSKVLNRNHWARINPLVHDDGGHTSLPIASEDGCRDRTRAAMARQE